ncbi:MBL fold metallo-hydrolase [Betaproteobacteria bacterium]|nr:MBL fold metallo-hydrolase [Betaproteobacteria bacterium]GHU41329.1 MBL fold metallo-hydrolase [Betaproteobacteria bacterium]
MNLSTFRFGALCRMLVAVALCMTLPPVVHAEPPAQAKVQAPGFYRVSVGDFEVTALYDGEVPLPQTTLYGLRAKDIQSLMASLFQNAAGDMQTAVNAFLIHTGDHLALVDTGAAECYGPTLGRIQDNIEAAGYKAEEIDTVLLTHLHADHTCGLLNQSGTAAFVNATVRVSEEDAAYWLDEAIAAQQPEASRFVFRLARAAVAPYIAAGKFKTWRAGDTLLPGLTTAPSPGHTPGHSGYLFSSKGENLLVWGDLIHNHAVQFPRPEVSFEFDSDRPQAVATRKKVLADAAKNRLIVAGAHLPFPGIGHVRAEKKGYRWIPVEFGQSFLGQ